MFPRLRFAIVCCALSTCALLCASAGGGRAAAQGGAARAGDQVYRYRGKNGREVFTNAGHVSIGGQAAAPLALPALGSVDLAGASHSQLQQLDRSVQLAHDELQTGERCRAIRASLRVPVSAFVWREHLRQVCVGIALLALALVVLVAWPGRLKRLMPLAPMLGCAFLGYVTYARIDRRLGALREGLHACSSDLPPAETSSPSAVKGRLASASELQATVDRAYRERAAIADSMLRER